MEANKVVVGMRKSLRLVGRALESLLAESRDGFADARRQDRWFIEPK